MSLNQKRLKTFTVVLILFFAIGIMFAVNSSAEDKIKLEIWDVYTHKAKSEVLDAAIEGFEEEHPNVEIQRTARPLSDTKAATMPALNAGRGPDIPTVNNAEHMMGPLVRGGHILDLTPYAEKYNWEEELFSAKIFNRSKYTEDGKILGRGNLYALGASGEIVGIFYNKDMFNRLGIEVPGSLAELEAAFDKLKSEGIIPLAYGGLEAWPFFHLFGEIQHSVLSNNIGANAAQDYLDDVVLRWDENRSWDNATNREAAAILQDWVKKDYFPQGFTGLKIDDAKSIFVAGKAGMFLQGNWYSGDIASADFNAGFFPFPPIKKGDELPPQIGGITTPLGISKYTDHPDLAAEFLDYWATSDVAAKERVNQSVLSGQVPMDLSDVDPDSLYYDLAETWNRVIETGRMGHYLDWTTPTMWDTLGAAGDKLLALKITPNEFSKLIEEDYRKWMENKPGQ